MDAYAAILRPHFAGFGADGFSTALTRACKASESPRTDRTTLERVLRHLRASLWHLKGVPAAQAASWLGHSAQEHLRTYAHVVVNRTEIDYERLSGERIGASLRNPQTAA
jgi:hypothetical protein